MRLKSLASLLAMALVLIFLAGCGDIISFSDPAVRRRETRRATIADFLSGDVTGETGETYQTRWFDFTIHSIDEVDSYAGHDAQEGYQLYKVQASLKNTSDDAIPMGTFDFYMDDPAFEEFIWPIAPLDDTMMPEQFDLELGEIVQYIMIFEVPAKTTELALVYTEFSENEYIGTSFIIFVD